MAIDVPTFRQRFPEFDKAPDTLVEAKLEEGKRSCRTKAWGDGAEREDGVFFTAARLLALSPQGRSLRLVSEDGSTIYDETLRRLQRAMSYGFRLI